MKKILSKIIPLLYGQYLNFLVIFNKKKAAKTAFDIFGTIRNGKVLPSQKEFLDPAKLEIEQVGEHQIQSYRWTGSGKTVLLMHGWESNSFRWRNLIKKLQAHNYTIIAFDAPAHGYSSGKKFHVPLYAEASRHILDKYRPKYVVAHSVGGMAILFDHYKTPASSVQKIVTIGSPCEFSQFIDNYQEIIRFNTKVRSVMDIRLKEWWGFHFHEFSSIRFVANNTKKGLLFHDVYDLQVPFSASKRVHEHWQGSQLVATKGLGHSMHQDDVNDQIIEFLQ